MNAPTQPYYENESNPFEVTFNELGMDQKSYKSPSENRGLQPKKTKSQAPIGDARGNGMLDGVDEASTVAKYNTRQNDKAQDYQQLQDNQTSASATNASTPAGGEYATTAPPQGQKPEKQPVDLESFLPYELKDGLYLCRQKDCGLHYTSTQVFNDHMRKVHKQPRPYRCDYCEQSFPTYSRFKVHWLSRRHQNIFKAQNLLDGQSSTSHNSSALPPEEVRFLSLALSLTRTRIHQKGLRVPEAWLPYRIEGEHLVCRIKNCGTKFHGTGVGSKANAAFHKHALGKHAYPAPYACRFCDENCSTLQDYNRHLKEHLKALRIKWEAMGGGLENFNRLLAGHAVRRETHTDGEDTDPATSSLSVPLPDDISSQPSNYVHNEERRGSADIDREPARRLSTPLVEPSLALDLGGPSHSETIVSPRMSVGRQNLDSQDGRLQESLMAYLRENYPIRP